MDLGELDTDQSYSPIEQEEKEEDWEDDNVHTDFVLQEGNWFLCVYI